MREQVYSVGCAVLIIDMLNFFAEEGDAEYQARFAEAADAIRRLRELADQARVPVIYLNTEFESRQHFASSAMARKADPSWIKGSAEAEVIPILLPRPTDHVIAKTVNSGFFETILDATLAELGVARLLISGVHTHVCVALTAADAFYRNYDVVVMADCVTTIDPGRHVRGLEYIGRHLGRLGRLDQGLELFA